MPEAGLSMGYNMLQPLLLWQFTPSYQMELQPDDSKVLFDGGSHPLPVALRHLRLGSAGGYNGRAEQQTVEPSRRTDGGQASLNACPKLVWHVHVLSFQVIFEGIFPSAVPFLHQESPRRT